ncbi:adenine nucleotide alpha hydrolases-like protein [Hypomontagnella monticulosa]|nr:adenine nucleotide alpha hydrolases-like protein [Hypomontagnella monticulosa]
MGTLHHVMHTGARPIGVHEFMDALRATCTPRFPHTRGTHHRRVGVAVSGGVDSMALAFLCSQVRKQDADFKIADNPVSGFRGMVIDHGLREGSREEGLAVCRTLENMGFFHDLLQLNWFGALGDYNHPKDLPNVESVARTLRYRKFGFNCAYRQIATLLLAHHEDDQYETVLMRLLQGHGSRGLRGMRKANAIPECEGMMGADQSGWIDDQLRQYPFYNTKPTRKERKYMHRALRSDITDLVDEAEWLDDSTAELPDVDVEDFYLRRDFVPIEPRDIDVEDGGVTVFRPLLEFSKDRLIATCLENKVPWWEDATNKDPTLTMRNAVRHMYKGYTLPKALQKPSILALARRCEQKAQAREAEANRLLSRTIIHDFEPHTGTVTVQFPKFAPRIAGRDSRSPSRRRARLLKLRQIAAILMRKILSLISPESQQPALTTLENHVYRLFPSLADPRDATTADPPKAFIISGVYLIPVKSSAGSVSGESKTADAQLSWYLSRAPYPSTQPLPRARTPYWASQRIHRGIWRLSPRMAWTLWDGRYWMHIEHRLPCRLIIQPFLPEHAKPFREALPPEERARLATFLKRYAPGKVRYTIPAIYLEEPLDLANPQLRPGYPNPISPEESMHPRVPDTSKMQLIALPSLDIHVPRFGDVVWYEIRYKRADRDTLQTAGTFHRGSYVPPITCALRKCAVRPRRGRGISRVKAGGMGLRMMREQRRWQRGDT